MVGKSSYEPGTPSWVDLGSPDPDASATFYSSLLGWDVVEGPAEAGGYRTCLVRDVPVAAISPQFVAGQAPAWLTYVTVADADAAAASVVEHGGAVAIAPFDVLTAGRMAVFVDPSGATFAVWQAGDHVGAGLVNEAGAFCWNEIFTPTPDDAMAFYGPLFGWEAAPMPLGDTEIYTVLMSGDRAVGGIVTVDAPPMWQVTFAVDDCDASVATALELGATVVMAPEDIPDIGRFAMIDDPHGARFGILASDW